MTTPDSPLVVTGSWEDRLAQARRMMGQYNDDAIPILRMIIERLNRLNRAQLIAGGFRLFRIRLEAARLLERCLVRKADFAAALEITQELISWMEGEGEGNDEDGEDEREDEARVLLMLALLGRYEDALAYAQRLIAAGADASEVLMPVAIAATDSGYLAWAEEVLAAIERDVNREPDAQRAREKRGQLALARMRLALNRKEWVEAIAWFDHACAVNPGAQVNNAVIYDPLVRAGQAERALPLIDQDVSFPMRIALWRGLALRSLGQEDAAQKIWNDAIHTDLRGRSSNPGIFEWVLCHYYLVEPTPTGYAFALQIVTAGDMPWFANCIAGLGACLHNDTAGAILQMNIALEKYRTDLTGIYIGDDVRYHFENLLTAEQMAPLLHYFAPRHTITETQAADES